MRNRRSEAGRTVLILLVLVGLSAGVIYARKVIGAPERHFQEGLEAHGLRDYVTAATAWQQAVDLGHLEAHARLGDLYLEGHGVARNHKRAFELFEIAAKEGDGASQRALARLYDEGRGVEPDLEQAVLWYWAAGKNDDVEAQLALGHIYAEGRGVERDYAEAATWYRKAAEAGLGDAQHALGILYYEGRGVEKDPSLALHWLTRAAEDGNIADAWYRVGRFHEFGEGVPEDLAQAVWCYDKAAKEQHTEALYRGGRLYELGRGAEQHAPTAVAMYRQAGTQGHGEAAYRLARAYEVGEGVRRSRYDAEKWYAKAVDNGHPEAMAALQAMGLDSTRLSRYQQRRIDAKRKEERERKRAALDHKMERPGTCEIGGTIEMRTRMDCLNRGGRFREPSGGSQGSFVTVDTERDWNDQRRELRRRQREQQRSEYRRDRSSYRDDPEPPSGDYIVCNARGSRDSSGRAHYRCSSAIPKTSATTTSWCREQGYDSRRLFKHRSSANSWRSRNCW